jgi:molybdopterin-synthase adenylyltransferase
MNTMTEATPSEFWANRYARQTAFAPFGPEGQAALGAARVLVVGVGGLGSWMAELLSRAGVGFLRLADSDLVDPTNLHRQAIYEEGDAEARLPKAEVLASRLARINRLVRVEALIARVDAANMERAAGDIDLILDGTDNFPTRYLLNDFAVKHNKPWIMAGVVGAEGQVAAIPPGGRPCLRCMLEAPPPACVDPNCREFGVVGPAVAAVASLAAMEAMRLLRAKGGGRQPGRSCLTRVDLWKAEGPNVCSVPWPARDDCPCCVHHEWDYLEH